MPGGPVGRRYVDLLTEEVQNLAVGNFPSERVLIFSSVMLQRDRMVRKGADIRRLLDWHIGQWRDGHFDLLVQEADRCDGGLKHSRRVNLTGDDVVRIFSRLMLQGKVKAAVRWATERTRGELLMPTDVVDNTSGTTVLDVLRQKHPSARPPKASSLVPCDVLPLFEDVEITGSHLLFVAHRIQGGAEPGGCDAGHWRDVLLRFGAYSSRLRDAVAALARRLLNSIVPWEDISALVANRLIALDKCPGVRSIGIGETL